MNLQYNILWFENDKGWLHSIQEQIEDFFFDDGFLVKIIPYKNAKLLDSTIRDIKSGQLDIDIVLMDYNLLDGDKGNDIIRRIRDKEIYTEIIFYSQKTEVKEKFKDECIEGIYFSERKDFLLRFKQIVPHTIKKVIDLTNMRGLVMAQTSLLDLEMNKLILSILKYIDSKDECRREMLVEKVFHKRLVMAHQIKEIEHTVEKVKKKDKIIFNVTAKLKQEYISDISILLEKVESSDRYKFVNSLLKENLCIDIVINDEHSIFKKYDKEIINKRNILAHVKEELDENGKKVLKSHFKGYEKFVFSHEDFKQIRQDLITHKENIEKMIEIVNKFK